jgi:ribonucleoside-triphosphate reductase
MRYSATQNVSINLPRIGYKAEKNDETLFLLIAETMKLCARAHIQKKNFIEKLVSYGDEGPLSVLAMSTDEEPFLKIKQAVHIMGMVGLNELVKIHKGTELHESDAARKFGLKIMSYMKDTADKLSAKYGTRFILGQTPAESTAYRFAKLDLKHFSPMAGRFVKGDISKGEIYYTNSTLFSVLSSTDPFDRAKFEGMFHPFIEGETATFLRLGDLHTPKEALAEFIVKVFKKTKSRQVVFSPEFTTCMDCKRTFRGIKESCIYCDSKNVEGIARITGYFSRVSGWNKGKLAELRDRKKQPDFTE